MYPFKCQTCQYVGHNEFVLFQHLETIESCKHFHEQKEVATGLLPDTSSACIAQKEEYHNITSYTFKRYSIDGIVDNIQFNMNDESRKKAWRMIQGGKKGGYKTIYRQYLRK